MSVQLLLIGGGTRTSACSTCWPGATAPASTSRWWSARHAGLFGHLPGHLASHYTLEQCSVPLDPLCEAATADFVRARVTKLDLEQRIALTDGGGVLPFDVVSIDIGPARPPVTIPGLQHALSVRPIDQLVNAWRALEQRFAGTPLAQTLLVMRRAGRHRAWWRRWRTARASPTCS